MSLWKWNNVELEIDMEDVAFQKKYEDAFFRMEESEKALQTVGRISDFSAQYCQMFFDLFDDIFGQSTSEKLFNGKKNIRLVEECYESFLDVCTNEVKEINKRRANAVKKYTVKSRR